jgi:hypothetical protein
MQPIRNQEQGEWSSEVMAAGPISAVGIEVRHYPRTYFA